jgi:hypothetical protein
MSLLNIIGGALNIGKEALQNRYENKEPVTKVGKFLSGVVGTPTAIGSSQFQQNQIAVNSMLGGTQVSLGTNQINNTQTLPSPNTTTKPMEKIQNFIKEKPLQAVVILGALVFLIVKLVNKKKGRKY